VGLLDVSYLCYGSSVLPKVFLLGETTQDIVYLVVTVGARANSYTLKKQAYGWREPKLAQNQYAYKIHIKTDEKEWQERIADVTMAPVSPPEHLHLQVDETTIGKDTPTRVMERLSQ